MLPRGGRTSLYFLVVCACLFILNLYFVSDQRNQVPEPRHQCRPEQSEKPGNDQDGDEKVVLSKSTAFACSADGKALSCLKDDKDVYIPFSFIKKRFDVSGRIVKDNHFEWSTSYAKVKTPDFPEYSAKSEFGHFASYSVETRERVRCINAGTGVPMSTQWDTTPYYYPIQIAQFGLQHYSRLVTANETERRTIVLGVEHRDWQGSASSLYESSQRTYFRDEETGLDCVNISSGARLSNAGVYLYLRNEPDLHVISFKWRPGSNASFTFLVKIIKSNTLVLLNYVQEVDERCVWSDNVTSGDEQLSFSYSLGDVSGKWSTVTRDLLVDAARALSSMPSGTKFGGNVIIHPGELKYVSIGFRGEVTVEQKVVQKTQAHEQMFLTTADWAVMEQNEMGGWSVPVERAIADRRLVLPSGWHSAMGQGHMLSLLSRAYLHTRNETYLQSAVKALDLFEKDASEQGVRNVFMGVHPWYEEYPTTPGSFVLNGFMYSLIGLFDLSNVTLTLNNDTATYANSTDDVNDGMTRASELFSTGVSSLKALLPLYDTGSGSIYDLRHYSLHTAPNLARWDYHAVHVYLLEWMHIITGDEYLHEVAKRWAGYARGNRAKHN